MSGTLPFSLPTCLDGMDMEKFTIFHMHADCVWNVMAHVQKLDFVFWWNRQVHLNRQGCQFSRLLAAEVCASAVVMVVMLDTPCSEAVWRELAAHSICQFPLHFPSHASPCAITFQLDSTTASLLACTHHSPSEQEGIPDDLNNQFNPSVWNDEHCSSWGKHHLSWNDEHHSSCARFHSFVYISTT